MPRSSRRSGPNAALAAARPEGLQTRAHSVLSGPGKGMGVVGAHPDSWTAGAMRSRLDLMKKVARSLRRHHLIPDWSRSGFTIFAGAVGVSTARRN